jgi:hypothetical protein
VREGLEGRSDVSPVGETARRGRENTRATARVLFVTEPYTLKKRTFQAPIRPPVIN